MFSMGVAASGSQLGEVTIELMPAEERGNLSSAELARRWETLTGSIPDAVELKFSASLFSAGDDVDVQLTGPSLESLTAAANEIKMGSPSTRACLRSPILSARASGRSSSTSSRKPRSRTYPLRYGTTGSTGLLRRGGLSGSQRGRDDIRVMVRYPRDERTSLGFLENMRIRTPSGPRYPSAKSPRSSRDAATRPSGVGPSSSR